LLPLPFTGETLRHTIERIRIVQDFLERTIALEHSSTYLEFEASTFAECEFLSTLAHEADCAILLDVNNVYVNSFNHGFDPEVFIDRIPSDRVIQLHLAGHTNYGDHIIDTHNGCVTRAVWELYRRASRRFGNPATLIEWDAAIPDFERVHREALKARRYRTESHVDATAV